MTKAGRRKDGCFRRLRKSSLSMRPLASVGGAEETRRRGDEAWGTGQGAHLPLQLQGKLLDPLRQGVICTNFALERLHGHCREVGEQREERGNRSWTVSVALERRHSLDQGDDVEMKCRVLGVFWR